MARAALHWSAADLARASAVGYATVARFELGQTVQPDKVAAMRQALEDQRVRFVEDGPFAGVLARTPAA